RSTALLPVRIGLRYVKGLREEAAERLLGARAGRPFVSIEDLVARAELDDGSVARLAESGALAALEPNRRSALWAAKGAARVASRSLRTAESPAAFADLDAAQSIGWDYATMEHSAHGHPLGPLRARMDAKRLPDARRVLAMPGGRRVHFAGLVICRQ